jgi:hypothetical protein
VVRFLLVSRLSHFVNVQTVSGAHRIFCSVIILGFFLMVKAVEACSWPTASLPLPSVRVRGATFPLTCTSPWRALKRRDKFYTLQAECCAFRYSCMSELLGSVMQELCSYYYFILSDSYHTCCGPGSVVGITTGYGLDGPGIESSLLLAVVE